MLLCFDGGGSSIRILFIDDGFNLIGEAKGFGVNSNHTPLTEIKQNLRDCLDTALGGYKLGKNDEAAGTLVGPFDELKMLLEKYGCPVKRISESEAALRAGALKTSGFVALSGTGSFISYFDASKQYLKLLGGLGLLLGDEGSGAWIGHHALKAVASDIEGSGEPTLLTGYAKNVLGIKNLRQLIRKVYDAPSYIRYMAAFVPEVARAADDGDIISLSLFNSSITSRAA